MHVEAQAFLQAFPKISLVVLWNFNGLQGSKTKIVAFQTFCLREGSRSVRSSTVNKCGTCKHGTVNLVYPKAKCTDSGSWQIPAIGGRANFEYRGQHRRCHAGDLQPAVQPSSRHRAVVLGDVADAPARPRRREPRPWRLRRRTAVLR